MSVLLIFYALFFHSFVDHQNLHSFPTRRSSDLENNANSNQTIENENESDSKWELVYQEDFEDFDINEKIVQDERSEEHTSELQSRGHLVCRLLLEKKKTKERRYITLINKPEQYL